ncbi:MAG: hypothetical protein MUC66_00085 [Methanolinea sp.]|jgi:hypothetical protein|nr:hypothetical protein [Methanolinea sp.]
MNRLRYLIFFLVVLPFLLGAGCLQEREINGVPEQAPASSHEAMHTLLGDVTSATQDSLNRLDETTSDTALALSTTGLSGPESDAVLKDAMASHPAILTMITYDENGTVLAAEPENVKVLLGQDLSGQETVQQALERKVPLMSDLFPLAQGGEAVAIGYPVLSPDGAFAGVVSTTFLPYELIAPVTEDTVKGTPYTFMVTEVGARILYDPDPAEVGKETFNETLYAEFPEILKVARNLEGNRSGYDTYSFYSTGFGKVVKKETFWSTVGLHGTEWRVLVIGEL